MSMMTLRLMQQAADDEDRAIDAREVKRGKARRVTLTPEEITAQGEELHEVLAKAANSGKLQVSCKLRPNSVVAYAIEKLKGEGWTAKHSYNDGYNAYDLIKLTPPTIGGGTVKKETAPAGMRDWLLNGCK